MISRSSIPCRHCVVYAICNAQAKKILRESDDDYIRVLIMLQDKCSLFRSYAAPITLLSTIIRSLKIVF